MTLPVDYTTIPVHGKWELIDGSPATGTVTFVPTQAILVDASFETIIMGSTIVETLDGGGEISFNLASTDDTDVAGTPFAYVVTVALEGVSPYTFNLGVPKATVGTIELATVTPVTIPTPPTGLAGGDLQGFYPNPTLAVDRIPKALLTTKGDVIVATAAGTPTRLPVGSDTQVIIADHTQASGVKWGTPPGGAPSGAAGGDLGSTYPNPTVTWGNGNLSGTLASRPAAVAGNAGKNYFATDIGQMFNSNGTAWTQVGGTLFGLLGWFSVKAPAYGAVGDGTTDDSAAVQAAADAAVNALNAGLSATVFLPNGKYYLATGVVSSHAGVTFIGEGSPGISTGLSGGNTQVVVGDGQWGFTLGSTSSSNFRGPHIENIEFYEKNAGLALGGVRTYRVGNGRYVNCAFGPFTRAVASTFNGTPGTLTSLGTTLTLASTTGWATTGSGRIATSGGSKLHCFTYTGISGNNLTGVAYNGGAASDTVAAAAVVSADTGIGFLNDGVGDNAPYNAFDNCRFGVCTVGYINRLANGTRMVVCTHDGADNGTTVTTGSVGILIASGDSFRAVAPVIQGYDRLMWFAKANNAHQVDAARWEIWKTVAVQLDGDNGTDPCRIQGTGDNSLLAPGGDTGFLIGAGVVGAWIQAMMVNTATVCTDNGTSSTIQIQNPSGYVNTGPLAAPVTSVAGRTGAVVIAESDVTSLVSDLAAKAALASPAFTGHPTGVTETALNNSTRLASTAYADAAVAVEASRATTAEALLAPLASPALTGTPTAPTQTAGNNSARLATTAYTTTAVAAEATLRSTADALLAPLASPALTGHPTGVTEAALDNSTRLASTAYADSAVGVETTRATAAEALLAPKASPTFTGTTTAPEFSASGLTGSVAASRYVGATASGAPSTGAHLVGDFVIDQTGKVWICTTAGTPGTWTNAGGGAGVSLETTTVPTVDGTAIVGARGTASDSAHVHPTDTSRAPTASPTFTGTVTLPSGIVLPAGVTAPTQSALDNSTKVATTAYADAAVAIELARAEAAEALALPLAGGTMIGAIAMGTSKITGLGNGSGAQDAAAFGQIPAAAAALSGIPKIIRRSSDSAARNSGNTGNTLTNDDTLFFAVAANEVWYFQAWLIVTSANTTMDMKCTFTMPTSGTMLWGVTGPNAFGGYPPVAAASTPTVMNGAGTVATFGTGGVTFGVGLAGVARNSTNAGNCVFQWAQNTADAGNLVLNADSIIIAYRLA